MAANLVFSQTTHDLYIQDVDISSDTSPPFEYCQGTVPTYQIEFRQYAGSTTLTLSSTKTIILSIQHIDPLQTRNSSVTISQFNGLVTELGIGGNAEYYDWNLPSLSFVNPGLNRIIFSYTISSTESIAALTSNTYQTIDVNVVETPDINDPISNSIGSYDLAREVDVCEGTNVTYYATVSDYTAWHFERRYGSGGSWVPITPSPTNVSSFTSTGIPPATGEQIKVTYYRGSCMAESLIYTTNVIPFSSSITLNTTSNTICQGDNLIFNVNSSGSTWYHFILETSGGVTSTVQSSTSNTYSSTSLNDGDKIIVRSYQVSNSLCFATASKTIRVLSMSGSNTIGTSATVCYPNPPGLISSTSSSSLSASLISAGATITFQWEYNDGGGWTNFGVTSEELNLTSPLTQTTAFRRQTIASLNTQDCIDLNLSNTVTLTVPNNSTITPTLNFLNENTLAVITGRTICQGENFIANVTPYFATATYTFTIDSNPVTSAAVSGSQYFTVSETTWLISDGSVVEVVVDYGGGCTKTLSSTIIITQLSGNNNITTGTTSYCSSADPEPIVSTSTQTTNYGSIQFQWEHRTTSPTNSNWSNVNLNGISADYDPPASLADGIHHYRRKIYVTHNGTTCESYTDTVTIQIGSGSAPTMVVTPVNASTSNVITNTAGTLYVCPGDIIDFNAASSSGNGYEYFLNSSSIQSPTASSTYTLSSYTDNSIFRVRNYENSDGSGCFNDTSFTLRINGWSGSNQIVTNTLNICEGGDPDAILSSSEPLASLSALGASIRYQWQRLDGSTWNDISGEVLKDYNPASGVVTTSTRFRRKAYVEILGNSCEIGVSSSTLINVTASYTASLTSSIPSLSVCGTESVTFTAFPSYATATYAFYLNGTSTILQGPSNVRTYTGTFLDGDNVRVKIEYNGCEITSTPLTLNVNSNPLAQLFAPSVSGSTICKNDLPLIEAQPSSSVSYTFFVGDGISQTAYNELSAAVSNNVLDLSDPSVTVYNPTHIDVRVYDNSTGCEDDTRLNGGTLILNLLELSVVSSNTIISTGTTSYCSGINPSIIDGSNSLYPSIPSATLIYNWEKRLSGTSSWTNLGVNTEDYDPPVLPDGTHEFRRLVTLSANGVTCTPTVNISNIISIEVGSSVTSVSVNLTSNASPSLVICEDQDVIFTATATGSPSFYEFYIGSNQVFSQSTTATTVSFTTASISSTIFDQSIVRVVVWTGAGGTGCSAESTQQFRVNSMSGQNRISHSAPGPFCDTHDPIAFTNDNAPISDLSPSSNIVYLWQFNDSGTWQDIVPSNTPTLDPQPISVTTAYRRLASTSYLGLDCNVPSGSNISNVVTITIDGSLSNNPSLSVSSPDVINQTFCEDQDVELTITPGISGATYEYQVGNGPRVNVGTSTFIIPYASITGGATITAYVTSGTCEESDSLYIQENIVLSAGTISGTQVVCADEIPNTINSLNSGQASGSISYRWESQSLVSNPVSDTWGITPVTTAQYNFTNTISESIRLRRVLISDFGPGQLCEEATGFVVITVANPTAVTFTNLTSTTICTGDTVTFEASVGGVGTFNYYFYINSGPPAYSVTNTSSTSIQFDPLTDASHVISNLDNFWVTVENSDNCESSSTSITVSVSPSLPAVSLNTTVSFPGNTFCEDEDVDFEATPVAGATYEYEVGLGGRVAVGSSSFTIPYAQLAGSATVTVYVTTGSCVSTDTIFVEENVISDAGTITGTQTICSGDTPLDLTSTSTG
ncbi:MAG: hypothetical protein ACPH7K_01730, partial [Flavobacteriaceae bacterium]